MKSNRKVPASPEGKARTAREKRGARPKGFPIRQKLPHRSGWRPLVTAFVVFHLIAISAFALPIGILPVTWIRDLLTPYMRCFGLGEQWDTFAPNPKSAEQYFKAVVLTQKGNTRIYSFPRMEELSIIERLRRERYRKFLESAMCNNCSGLWPDVGKNVARNMMDPADPPAKVILIKFESPIDPKSGTVGDDLHAVPTVLSKQSIEPGDLR